MLKLQTTTSPCSSLPILRIEWIILNVEVLTENFYPIIILLYFSAFFSIIYLIVFNKYLYIVFLFASKMFKLFYFINYIVINATQAKANKNGHLGRNVTT